MISKVDPTGTDKINFTEFIIANYNHQKLFQKEAIERAFDFFDKVFFIIN
jgi:Ca2+-binding EF-hand superfamily protein